MIRWRGRFRPRCPRASPMSSGRVAGRKPVPLLDLDRRRRISARPSRRWAKPFSTMICGRFSLSRPSPSKRAGVATAGPAPGPAAERDWLETILRRMVAEAALQRPGQLAVPLANDRGALCRGAAQLIKVSCHGEGGWLGAIADRHIGKALQLIHEHPEHPWTLGALGRHVGLGRSTFAARLYQARRPACVPLPRRASYGRGRTHARIGRRRYARVRPALAMRRQRLFQGFKQHYSFSPGRYRARSGTGRPAHRICSFCFA